MGFKIDLYIINYNINYIMEKNKVTVGSYVYYKKLQSFAKILEIDVVSHSYTIDCNGRIINTNDDFLDFNIGIRYKSKRDRI